VSALRRSVVMGRLLGCCGPFAKAAVAKQNNNRFVSFIVLLLGEFSNLSIERKEAVRPKFQNRRDGLGEYGQP